MVESHRAAQLTICSAVIGLAGLLFVIAGSLLATIAPDPALLIAARLVAGVGTA
jgi:hypothetical protein